MLLCFSMLGLVQPHRWGSCLVSQDLGIFLSLVDLKGGRPNHGTVPMPHYGWVGLCGSQVLHWLQSLHSGWLWELGAYCAPPAHAFSWQLSRCGCPPGRRPTLQVHSMLESVYQRLQVWALWLTVEPASPPEHSPAFTKFHVVFPEHYYYPYRATYDLEACLVQPFIGSLQSCSSPHVPMSILFVSKALGKRGIQLCLIGWSPEAFQQYDGHVWCGLPLSEWHHGALPVSARQPAILPCQGDWVHLGQQQWLGRHWCHRRPHAVWGCRDQVVTKA